LLAEVGKFREGQDSDPSEDFEKIDLNESPSWRTDYYQRKLGIRDPEKHPEAVQAVAKKYIEGLQWTLYYYFRGLASWSWFYPHHYSPLVIDLIELTSLGISTEFQKGQPFLPFQQLMAVLPPQSFPLVPKPFRSLMKEVRRSCPSFACARLTPPLFFFFCIKRALLPSLSFTQRSLKWTLRERRTTGKGWC